MFPAQVADLHQSRFKAGTGRSGCTGIPLRTRRALCSCLSRRSSRTSRPCRSNGALRAQSSGRRTLFQKASHGARESSCTCQHPAILVVVDLAGGYLTCVDVPGDGCKHQAVAGIAIRAIA